MAEQQDDLDFDSMLDDCASGLDTKITPLAQTQTTIENAALNTTEQSELPVPQANVPQMHVQGDTAVTTQEEQKVDGAEPEDESVEDAMKDFQDTLKEVLTDDGNSEEAMKQVEQMMQFLQQNIEQPPTGTATTPAQPDQPAATEGMTFLQKMMEAQNQQPQATASTPANSDPFAAGSTSAMFNDFQRAKTEEEKNTAGAAGGGADLPPGMNEADLGNMEKQFMGMFQNIAKQMENMDDGDSEEDDDDNLTEAEKKEAEDMMKNLFGAMGVDPSAAGNPMGGMPGMPNMADMMGGMGGGPSTGGAQPTGQGPDFNAQMNQFEQMFKSMGMQMDPSAAQQPTQQTNFQVPNNENDADDLD